MGAWVDSIYSQVEETETWHRIYPEKKVFKRDFFKEALTVNSSIYPEISIVTLFCGRFHTLVPYFWQLANLDYDKKKIHLILYCSSENEFFKQVISESVKKIGKEYGSVRLVFDNSIKPSKLAYSEKNVEASLHMENIPRLYKKAFDLVKTRYFFSFEDDQVNPSHTIKRFLKLIKLNDVASICGIAFDRHNDRDKPVAFDFYINPRGNRIGGKFVEDRKFCINPVGSSGFGATVFDSERMKNIEITQRLDEASDLLGCDVTFGYQVNKSGGVVLNDWDVRSYHIDSNNKVL